MQVSASATLSKWGNSQGVRIPKEICDYIGAQVGSVVGIKANREKSQIVLSFDLPPSSYSRGRKVSLEELCQSWEGGKIGKEWAGADVGAEVVD